MDEICPHCLSPTKLVRGIGPWCPKHGDDLNGHAHTLADGIVTCHSDKPCTEKLPTGLQPYFFRELH